MQKQEPTNPNQDEKKIKELLLAREKTKEKIKKLKGTLKDSEMENEEAWPGHEGTRYQTLELDYQLLLEHLTSIDQELKKLGYKIH